MEKNNLKSTDWDKYYQKPYTTAKFSRKITENLLINLIRKFSPKPNPCIAELGGANSCFFERIMSEIKPLNYCVIDNNSFGIKEFLTKYKHYPISALEQDVLRMSVNEKVDVVLSIGLIEHFDEKNFPKAVGSHFDLLEKEGLAIITFPTPTFLYKTTRFFSELLGLWIFHDETPISMSKAEKEIAKYGSIVFKKINWPIFLTQGIIVAKKK